MLPRFVTMILIAGVLCSPSVAFAAYGTQSSPKLLNLYLGWRIKDQDQAALSKWDVVVLDIDLQWQFPDRIAQLRKDNPNIKILAYVSASELADARATGDHASPGYHLSQRVPEAYFMHNHAGQHVSWWPGAQLLNVTDHGPIANGRRWNQELPLFVKDELMATGLWDGVFLDGAFSDITHFYGTDIDPDGDGVANSPAEVNAWWKEGMTKLINGVRAAVGPGRLILNNSSDSYANHVNGVLYENFPRYGWAAPFKGFIGALSKNASPSISAFNTNTNNVESPNDYRLMRYGLGSALLGNGYFSFDAGDRGHERTWWYDEYNVALGNPKGPLRRLDGPSSPIVPGVWMRVFERGIVLVNSDTKMHPVALPGTFEKLRGTQDRGTNDGTLVRVLDLPPQDALILLGEADATDLSDGGFMNGNFVRVYHMDGTQVRNGFFPQRDAYPTGIPVLVVPTSQGEMTVSANNGVIKIAGVGARSFLPFGSRYRGRISFAIEGAQGEYPYTMVIARDKSGPPEVRVYSRVGKLVSSWMAYAPSFTGGVRVAIGDIDGNGHQEVVTGAGPGGGPHVRIFKTDGSVWGGSFFAFDSQERGGVSVATGDLNGDGKEEIVVGSGEGAIPRVRVFDYHAKLVKELVLGSSPIAKGLSVSVADVDGDGKKDMIVSGLSAF